MAAIIGNQNPKVGETNFYEVSIFGSLSFFNPGSQYEWYLFKKQKNGNWKDITKNGIPKTGTKVDYTFFEPVAGDLFEIRVIEVKQALLPATQSTKTLYGKLEVRPTAGKSGQIDKVVLFNRGKKDINKADYKDTLIAQAFCTGLFGQEIEFQLWEDDAAGEGHNPEINKNNKIPRVYKAIVNEKGIAEAKISLSTDEKVMRQIANKYLMKGDKDEGATHEYYVTATHLGKGEKASQVNVNVNNPDYKPKPKENSPKFPATTSSNTPKQPDSKGKIIDAYFVDANEKKLTKVKTGEKIRVRINSQNLKGKNIQYVVWEYDQLSTNDEVYRSGKIRVDHDAIVTGGFTLTDGIFSKGSSGVWGDSDNDKQNYFIEVILLDASAESKKFGVDSGGLMEVEKLKSPAVVNKEKEATKDTCICQTKDLVWGDKIGCKERQKVIEVSKNLGVDPNWLMTVIALETAETFSPSIDNGIGYVGLIQFGADAAKDVGTTQSALIKMSFVDQMKYVEKHLTKNKSKFKTLADLYLAVLYPSASGKGSDRDYVVLEGKAYQSNPLFFKEKGEWEWATKVNKKGKTIKFKKAVDPDGKTYVWEIAMVAQEVYTRGLAVKEKNFTCNNSKPAEVPKTGDCLDTWDTATNNRIAKLHPKIRCAVKNFINEVDKTMGIKLRVIQGFRTYAEQNALYAQGRTTKGKKVTNAKGGQSNHNFGLAIDVAEIKNGNIDWNEQEKVLPKIAPIGKKWGFEWGGDWKSIVDKPHFEMMFGKSLADLRKLYEENGNDHTKIPL